MSRVAEDQVLAARRRDAVVTAAAFAAVADHGLLAHLQRADDAWLRLMISGRAAPVTAVAKVFNWLGLVYVTLPVRIGIAGFLALCRRWLAPGRVRRGHGAIPAVSAVLIYRLATYWLPVLPGWLSWRLLQRMGYL